MMWNKVVEQFEISDFRWMILSWKRQIGNHKSKFRENIPFFSLSIE